MVSGEDSGMMCVKMYGEPGAMSKIGRLSQAIGVMRCKNLPRDVLHLCEWLMSLERASLREMPDRAQQVGSIRQDARLLQC